MDPFTDLVRGIRANSALLSRSVLTPPWSLRYTHPAELTLCTTLTGTAWLTPDGGEPVRLPVGDVAVLRGPDSFVVADEPGRAPQFTVRCDVDCEPDTTPAAPENTTQDTANLVVGAYAAPGDVGRRLLDALPPVLVVPGDEVPCMQLDLIIPETCPEQPGHQVVLDRLLDLLLVCTLRAWFDRAESDPPAWYHALGDPVIGPVLRAMHTNPGGPWTVDSLAAVATVSRASFARRFTELVGEPPLTYLTNWRMTLAADLLRREGVPVATVASRVGYADGFAFSSAFKRVRGMSPSAYRAGTTTVNGSA